MKLGVKEVAFGSAIAGLALTVACTSPDEIDANNGSPLDWTTSPTEDSGDTSDTGPDTGADTGPDTGDSGDTGSDTGLDTGDTGTAPALTAEEIHNQILALGANEGDALTFNPDTVHYNTATGKFTINGEWAWDGKTAVPGDPVSYFHVNGSSTFCLGNLNPATDDSYTDEMYLAPCHSGVPPVP